MNVRRLLIYGLCLLPVYLLRFFDPIKGLINGFAMGTPFVVFEPKMEWLTLLWFLLGLASASPILAAVTWDSPKPIKKAETAVPEVKAEAKSDFGKFLQAKAEPKRMEPVLETKMVEPKPDPIVDTKLLRLEDGSEWRQVKPPSPPTDVVDPELLQLAKLLKSIAQKPSGVSQ